MKDTDPDIELLARIGSHDAAAVKQMVSRKLPRLLALANRLLGDSDEAKDVVQDSFVKLWKHAAHWRAGHAKFDTWLHRVVLNLRYDRLRGRKPLVALDDEEASMLIDLQPRPDDHLEASVTSERMAAALAALPDRQREAIVLQYYQELSNIEAASLMGISVDALESLLSRARRNLRNLLAESQGRAIKGRKLR